MNDFPTFSSRHAYSIIITYISAKFDQLATLLQLTKMKGVRYNMTIFSIIVQIYISSVLLNRLCYPA